MSSVGWIYDPVILLDESGNPIIKVGRRALAIDERRCFFHDKIWDKAITKGDPDYLAVQDINQSGLPECIPMSEGVYPEAESGLSKLALEWMLCQAHRFGLKVDVARADVVLGRSPLPQRPPCVLPNPAGKIHFLHGP